MIEDFRINIKLRTGIYVDRYGVEYELQRTIKNMETLQDMVILKSLQDENIFVCSVEYFTSPYLNEDEDLLPLFRIKELFKETKDENFEI